MVACPILASQRFRTTSSSTRPDPVGSSSSSCCWAADPCSQRGVASSVFACILCTRPRAAWLGCRPLWSLSGRKHPSRNMATKANPNKRGQPSSGDLTSHSPSPGPLPRRAGPECSRRAGPARPITHDSRLPQHGPQVSYPLTELLLPAAGRPGGRHLVSIALVLSPAAHKDTAAEPSRSAPRPAPPYRYRLPSWMVRRSRAPGGPAPGHRLRPKQHKRLQGPPVRKTKPSYLRNLAILSALAATGSTFPPLSSRSSVALDSGAACQKDGGGPAGRSEARQPQAGRKPWRGIPGGECRRPPGSPIGLLRATGASPSPWPIGSRGETRVQEGTLL